ncbi:single-stranded DNA-binding protein [Rarobacter incanus]|uniref:Single-stranded DNA-binding protein n=1 Tax=Rarobacter incanus TaxID=153494 RepID=A0A542SRZ1_9MICO|nr:single-stranded DNA-binding protein [Rarobacter incanus]TQK77385.1 single-stranded DNA-binding protein [Rarobacter incanus]
MAKQQSLVTLHVWAATNPEVFTTPSGRDKVTFRIADSVRSRSPETGVWGDSKTTWYTVTAWGDLGANIAESVRKGDPLIVVGHPWVDHYIKRDGNPGVTARIEAVAVGLDLRYGTSRFARVRRAASSDEVMDEAAAIAQTNAEFNELTSELADVDPLTGELRDDAGALTDGSEIGGDSQEETVMA